MQLLTQILHAYRGVFSLYTLNLSHFEHENGILVHVSSQGVAGIDTFVNGFPIFFPTAESGRINAVSNRSIPMVTFLQIIDAVPVPFSTV